MSDSGDFHGEIGPEVHWLLHEELGRLPDDYRQAVRLCYLEGLTHQEAARKLGWPLGTVKVRLVRGRQLLRERLDRRGVSLGAAVLLWLWEAGEVKAVSPTLANSTVRAMKLAAAGRKAAVSAAVSARRQAGRYNHWHHDPTDRFWPMAVPGNRSAYFWGWRGHRCLPLTDPWCLMSIPQRFRATLPTFSRSIAAEHLALAIAGCRESA